MKYPNLFEPIKIGGTFFKNRIFSSPTGHPNVTPEGVMSDDFIAYFERKAQGGAAAITLGETSLDTQYWRMARHTLNLEKRGARSSLARLADSINRRGAVVSIELQNSGRLALTDDGEPITYGPSGGDVAGVHILEMPEELILEVIEKFAQTALMIKQCGFGMVTVHGGHGWLLNQFFTPNLNKRTDKWGGSAENRARFAVETVDAIHRVCGADFPVETRISAIQLGDGGYGIDEGIKYAQMLDGHADIIHVSVGGLVLYDKEAENENFCNTHPSMFLEDGVNVKYAAEIKKHVNKSKVATVGALSDPALLEDIIASGKADIVEMARGLMCDPDIPNKAADGREDEIIHCMRCYSCFSAGMGRGHFFCSLNPETNRERYFERALPEPQKQKVLVAGGGIGGMQAALTAAKNGHEVILCEKEPRLGGNILCEENVPFKKHMKEYIELQERLISRAPIDLRLSTEVTPEYADSVGADVIIAAFGACPVIPDIPGIDGPNVVGAAEIYADPEKAGPSVVILGAGLVGTELAIYMSLLGKKAVVTEITGEISLSGNFLHGMAIEDQIVKQGIEVLFNTKALKIDEGGVLCETPEGEKYLKCDTVIYAVGYKPLFEEAAALRNSARRFYALGDCVKPRTISEANEAAMTIAREIGRF